MTSVLYWRSGEGQEWSEVARRPALTTDPMAELDRWEHDAIDEPGEWICRLLDANGTPILKSLILEIG